jgi:hypothetical protein
LQLAHAPRNAVSAAYNHAQHLKGRAMMLRHWADYLERTQRGANGALVSRLDAQRQVRGVKVVR